MYNIEDNQVFDLRGEHFPELGFRTHTNASDIMFDGSSIVCIWMVKGNTDTMLYLCTIYVGTK
jgi:hypothetical protein